MLKRNEVAVGGIYSNRKNGRFYSERKVTDIKINKRYPILTVVEYQIESGYVSHQLSDHKGSMTIVSFQKWAAERLDTMEDIPVHSFAFECKCGKLLEAGYHFVGQTVETLDCDCGLRWTVPQPRCIKKEDEKPS
jgi:hypothetical protein